MSTFTRFDSEDIVQGSVSKNITSGLFSGGAGAMTTFHTSSAQTASAAGTNYYWDVYHQDPDDSAYNDSAEVQFQISYGHYAGSGSYTADATAGLYPSRAIYSQFRNLLLDSPTPTTTFKLADNTDVKSAVFITLERSKFKEQLDKGDWHIEFANSNTGNNFIVTDDSSKAAATIENGHVVYNIVSGSSGTAGVYESSGEYDYWGKVYPELGIIMLEGEKMLGDTVGNNATHLNLGRISSNLGESSTANDNVQKYVYNSLVNFTGRADEDISSTFYFVRAKNSEYNFSTNETFVSGDAGRLRHGSMIGDPQVYISTVGLYNGRRELLAVAKLSKPLLKNYEREATIRIKLDY